MLITLVFSNEIHCLCSCMHKDMKSHLSWLVVSEAKGLVGKVVVHVHTCMNCILLMPGVEKERMNKNTAIHSIQAAHVIITCIIIQLL